MEMTSNRIGDAPVLPDLLAQIPAEEPIGSVTADGIYDTRGCHIAIAARGANAVIPHRRDARDWKGQDPGLQARNEALHACRRFGRANWKKLSGYHRRSRVEARMRCLKLPGERIMAKDFDRQDAEVQIRIVSQVLSNQWRSPAPHEPLHITRDARYRPHALKISGKGTSPDSIRIAQQSPSASGKSSLARALIGVWPAIGGVIRLNGAGIGQYDPDVLGGHIGYLPQRVALFDGTIAENIARLKTDGDPADVVTAAKRAGAHEMIVKLPEGYNTRVTANGGRLSGGRSRGSGWRGRSMAIRLWSFSTSQTPISTMKDPWRSTRPSGS